MYSKILIRYIYADNLFEGSQYRGTEEHFCEHDRPTWHVIKTQNNLSHDEGGHIIKKYEWLQAQIDVSCEDMLNVQHITVDVKEMKFLHQREIL